MMPRIDAHHHVWDLDVRDQPWVHTTEFAPLRRSFALAELKPQAAAAGVGTTILVQTVCDVSETTDLLRLASESPFVAGVVGWVDLELPDVAERLATLRGALGGERLVGIRHQVQSETDSQWLIRESVRRGLRAVADWGLAYDLVILPHQIPAAAEAVRAMPDARWVLDHAAKPPLRIGQLSEWERDIRALAASGNVVCKLSGLVTEANWLKWTVETFRPCIDVLLECFGPERLAFGSDWPVCTVAASYRAVVHLTEELIADLSEFEKASIWSGTAARAYDLRVGA